MRAVVGGVLSPHRLYPITRSNVEGYSFLVSEIGFLPGAPRALMGMVYFLPLRYTVVRDAFIVENSCTLQQSGWPVPRHKSDESVDHQGMSMFSSWAGRRRLTSYRRRQLATCVHLRRLEEWCIPGGRRGASS